MLSWFSLMFKLSVCFWMPGNNIFQFIRKTYYTTKYMVRVWELSKQHNKNTGHYSSNRFIWQKTHKIIAITLYNTLKSPYIRLIPENVYPLGLSRIAGSLFVECLLVGSTVFDVSTVWLDWFEMILTKSWRWTYFRNKWITPFR
jgi:hypothetical protein